MIARSARVTLRIRRATCDWRVRTALSLDFNREYLQRRVELNRVCQCRASRGARSCPSYLGRTLRPGVIVIPRMFMQFPNCPIHFHAISSGSRNFSLLLPLREVSFTASSPRGNLSRCFCFGDVPRDHISSPNSVHDTGRLVFYFRPFLGPLPAAQPRRYVASPLEFLPSADNTRPPSQQYAAAHVPAARRGTYGVY